MAFPHAGSAANDGVKLPDLDMSLESVDQLCLDLGHQNIGVLQFRVGQAQPVVFGAAPGGNAATNGTAVMARGHAAYSRTANLPCEEVAAFLQPHLPKGMLAQKLCKHLNQMGASFLVSETATFRQQVFIAVNQVVCDSAAVCITAA